MTENNVNVDKPEPISLISLNANGLGEANKNKRKSLIRWLNKFHNGEKKIILLQETHAC